jgi:hypothetical protein
MKIYQKKHQNNHKLRKLQTKLFLSFSVIIRIPEIEVTKEMYLELK